METKNNRKKIALSVQTLAKTVYVFFSLVVGEFKL